MKKIGCLLLMITIVMLSSCTKICNHYDYDYNYECDECGSLIEIDLVNLEELLKKNEVVVKRGLKGYINPELKLHDLTDLDDNEYQEYVDIFGKGVTKFISIETPEEVGLYAIEYESVLDAKNGKKLLTNWDGKNHYDMYPYSNVLACLFGRRSLLFYEQENYNGSIYAKNKSILVECFASSKLELPDSVIRIDSSACLYNTYLKEVVLNENLRHIGGYAFMYCDNLTNITLNEKLETIEYQAFYYCPLDYLVIPKSVTKISAKIVNNIIVYCEAEEKQPSWHEDAFIDAKEVYYAGEWEYNSEGIPTPIIDNEI